MTLVATVPLSIFWGSSEETFYLTGDPTDFKDNTPDATLVVRNIACYNHLTTSSMLLIDFLVGLILRTHDGHLYTLHDFFFFCTLSNDVSCSSGMGKRVTTFPVVLPSHFALPGRLVFHRRISCTYILVYGEKKNPLPRTFVSYLCVICD